MEFSKFHKVMKACALIVFGWCFIIHEGSSQTQANVTTPKASSVTA